MTHEKHRPSLSPAYILHLADRLLLELRISHGQDLVHDQDFRFQVRCNGETKTDRHTGRIPLDGRIDISFATGEIDDLVQFQIDIVLRHPHNGAIHVDILASGHFPVETRSHLQQGSDPAAGTDRTHRRTRHLGQELQQRALPRPVLADDAHDIPLLDLEVDVPEGPDILAVSRLGAVIRFTDLEVRVFLSQNTGLPPPVQVVRQGFGGHQAQPVLFSYMVEFNCRCHILIIIQKKGSRKMMKGRLPA